MARFTATFRSSVHRFTAEMRGSPERFDAEFKSLQTIVDVDDYTGVYAVTPSAEAQVLPTNGLRMLDNVTIGPIPSDYGHISWNGSVLTVS